MDKYIRKKTEVKSTWIVSACVVSFFVLPRLGGFSAIRYQAPRRCSRHGEQNSGGFRSISST